MARDVELGIVKLHLAEVKIDPRKLSPEKLIAGKLKPLYEETRSYEIGRDVCVREVVAITFGGAGIEWEEAFGNRVREAVKKQGVKMCNEDLDVSVLTPSRMARLARKANAHSLASAIEVFMKFIKKYGDKQAVQEQSVTLISSSQP